MNTDSQMEIKSADVARHEAAATDALRASTHTPSAQALGTPQPSTPEVTGVSGYKARPSFGPGAANGGASAYATRASESVSLLDAVQAVRADDPLPSDAEAHVLRVVRRGVAVARAVGALYETTTELGKLKEMNGQGVHLVEAQRVQLTELQYAAALVVSFVAANYVGWALGDYMPDVQTPVEAPEPTELRFDNPAAATAAFVWELAALVKAQAKDDASLVKLVRDHCARRCAALALRADGAKHLERFKGLSYRLEGEDFTVKGFAPSSKTKSVALTFQFKKPHEVVGNAIAKQQMLRASKQLLCYDFERKKNPFVELGGFIFTGLGDGEPGTGKTTLLLMQAGLVSDMCQVAGVPFRFQNLGVEAIDSYQGKSGQNARAFADYIFDPNSIGLGCVDDADQVCANRKNEHASEGAKEITGALMSAWAGPNTIIRGNCSFWMFSNHADKIDDALRQRAQARFIIDGPQTREDFQDLLALQFGEDAWGAVGLGRSAGTLFETQTIQEAVAKAYEQHNRPHEPSVATVFDRIVAEVGPLKDLYTFSVYMKRLQELDKRFTGRAVNNVCAAVKTRMMDFDMPDEWFFDNPDLFLRKPYEEKLAIIREMRQPLTAELLLQELNRYADSEVRYSDKSFQTAVDDAVRRIDVEMAARTAITARKGQ